MNQQTIQRIADTHAACLGIVDDGAPHLQIAVLIEIGVYHTGACLDDGDTGGVAHEVDELSAATGDAEIHIADGIQHLTRCLMGGG